MDITIKLEIDGRPIPLKSFADLQTVKSLMDIVLRSQNGQSRQEDVPGATQSLATKPNDNLGQQTFVETDERLVKLRERQQSRKPNHAPLPGERGIDYAIKAWFVIGKDIATLAEMTEQMLILGWGTASAAPESVARSVMAEAKRYFKKLPDRTWQYIGPEQSHLEGQSS